ncbi:MAG TPA: orotidine 5'-phosphate decarboxylase / HUMPS family protein [Candidatus Nanoarchaeia archaeon]|nr:orotidine 5'-phosphate decarboxylase / HUMPS family protein [Candidatus Nanoarchaeia archaeon]
MTTQAMDEGKRKLIKFLFDNGLGVFEDPANDRTLKSKRLSPWFLNIGDFNDGTTLAALSEAYADTIIASGVQIDTVYGIPEKGVGLVGPVATELARKGRNVGWFFTRKLPKEHGEASGKTDLTKLIVGRIPTDGQAIGQLDDVFTSGEAKYSARAELEGFGKFCYPLLAIALDRQEVAIDGNNAIEGYETKTGTRVVSAVRATDVLDYMKEQLSQQTGPEREVTSRRIERLSTYLRVYGTDTARSHVGALEERIITSDRSVIPACDIDNSDQFISLLNATKDNPDIGGYKIGFELGLTFGLPNVVQKIRALTDKPVIYDHQKAGTDIPDTGRNFARTMKRAGVDAVIFFPQAGPETERAWIYHARDNGLKVIVGGWMTHPAYAESEGGFLRDEGILDMYRIAARAGVTNFVVPGTKPDVIKRIREAIVAEGISNPILYGPGLGIGQGGDTKAAREAAGAYFHAIVGRGITGAEDMRTAALEHTSQLKAG